MEKTIVILGTDKEGDLITKEITVPEEWKYSRIEKVIYKNALYNDYKVVKWDYKDSKTHQSYSTKNTKLDKHKTICEELSDIYEKKNHDYGDSFSKLYEEYGMLSVVIRLFDKLYRLENLMEKEQMVEDESIENTLKDLANYSIMALMERGE